MFLVVDQKSGFFILSLLFKTSHYHKIGLFFCLLIGIGGGKRVRCVRRARKTRLGKLMNGLNTELLLHLSRDGWQLENPHF